MIFGIEINWLNILSFVGAVGGIVYLLRMAILLTKIHNNIIKLAPVVPIILDIAKQFRTDSGSSLRDELNKVSEAAKMAKEAATTMQSSIDDLRREQVRLAIESGRSINQTTHIGQAGVGENIGQEQRESK